MALPNSYYPKELNFPWPFPEKPSMFYRLKSVATISFVYLLSKSIFFAMLTFKEFFWNIDRFRYTLAAHNICFTRPLHTRLFSLGRCVPCVRGAGVFQTGVDFCVNMLSQNAWVHVFPGFHTFMCIFSLGSVLLKCATNKSLAVPSFYGFLTFFDETFESCYIRCAEKGRVTKAPIRIKWGISRLIMESKSAPILLPIWINGMQNISPERPPYYPKIGNIVEVTVGEPVDTSTFLNLLVGQTELEKRKEVADIVQQILFDLGGVRPALGPPPAENERII